MLTKFRRWRLRRNFWYQQYQANLREGQALWKAIKEIVGEETARRISERADEL